MAHQPQAGGSEPGPGAQVGAGASLNAAVTRRDTIAAISSAPGRAAIGVVRVSGADLRPIAEKLVGRALVPRVATLAAFSDADDATIDQGIALYFPGPASYTGEDVLELQGHGGPVVLRMLLQRCLELGARVAEPGEFTQRAFLNGKLDLLQAEGVIDLIDASTQEAARSAVRSLQGAFSARIHALNEGIVELRALVEATLDFPEEDIDALDRAAARRTLGDLQEALDAVVDAARKGSVLREGLHVVIAGEPNVGKSSLLNALAGQERAIVTEIPGTTRDPIREALDLDGIPLHIVDTAGLRETEDPVERIGVDRARAAIAEADVVLVVADARRPVDSASAALQDAPPDIPRITVMNKIDLASGGPALEQRDGRTIVWLSAKTGEGVDLLRSALRELAGWHGAGESVFLARERHLTLLASAREHLLAAGRQTGVEFFAEELRLAHRDLSSITGEFTADDLLGEIFSRFCMGK